MYSGRTGGPGLCSSGWRRRAGGSPAAPPPAPDAEYQGWLPAIPLPEARCWSRGGRSRRVGAPRPNLDAALSGCDHIPGGPREPHTVRPASPPHGGSTKTTASRSALPVLHGGGRWRSPADERGSGGIELRVRPARFRERIHSSGENGFLQRSLGSKEARSRPADGDPPPPPLRRRPRDGVASRRSGAFTTRSKRSGVATRETVEHAAVDVANRSRERHESLVFSRRGDQGDPALLTSRAPAPPELKKTGDRSGTLSPARESFLVEDATGPPRPRRIPVVRGLGATHDRGPGAARERPVSRSRAGVNLGRSQPRASSHETFPNDGEECREYSRSMPRWFVLAVERFGRLRGPPAKTSTLWPRSRRTIVPQRHR